jgi:hypothetical protein
MQNNRETSKGERDTLGNWDNTHDIIVSFVILGFLIQNNRETSKGDIYALGNWDNTHDIIVNCLPFTLNEVQAQEALVPKLSQHCLNLIKHCLLALDIGRASLLFM